MPETMTFNEMVKFTRENPFVKVTHELFSPDEFIYADRVGDIYSEEGYLFENWTSKGHHNGLRLRTDKEWTTGWSLYKETINE